MPHLQLEVLQKYRKSQEHQNKFDRQSKLTLRRKRQNYEISDNTFLIRMALEHFQRMDSLQQTHFQTRNRHSSNNFSSHQFTSLFIYALLLMYFAQPVVSQSEEHNSPLTNIPNNNRDSLFYPDKIPT